MNLNMKASDQMLSTIADLGFRKCREWLDEYFVLEKKLTKLKFTDLHKSAGIYIFYASKMEERYPDMVFNPNKFKGMNSIQLNAFYKKPVFKRLAYTFWSHMKALLLICLSFSVHMLSNVSCTGGLCHFLCSLNVIVTNFVR